MLSANILTHHPPTTTLPFLAYHLRPDFIGRLNALGAKMRPLKSSKGDGHEMIYVVNSSRVTPRMRERLFVWGLDNT